MEGKKRASWRQSTKGTAEPGEDERVRGKSRRRDTRRRLPPAHPTPEGAHGPGGGVASAPLTKTVHFRLVWGTHFLFHLSDSIMPPL